MAMPEYRVYVDWDNEGGLYLATFENDLDGWGAEGTQPPTVERSTLNPFNGDYSMKVSWPYYAPFQFDTTNRGFDRGKFGIAGLGNPPTPFQFDTAGNGFDQGRFGSNSAGDPAFNLPRATKTLSNLVVGRSYVLSMAIRKVYQGDGFKLIVAVDEVAALDPVINTVEDTWEVFTLPFTATSSSHVLSLSLTTFPTNPGSPDIGAYFDSFRLLSDYGDITDRVLARDDLSFRIGRDIARNLSDVTPGETAMELLNRDFLFTPDNTGSPLYGKVGPGKPVLVTSTWDGKQYDLFQGFLDDYTLLPEIESQSVQTSAIDLLGQLAQNKITTPLYPGLRTGDAVHKVLDAVGWPQDRREVDPGASIISWWWEEDTDAFEALQKIMRSEGPPALLFVDSAGVLIFRDRHHRLLDPRSLDVQAELDPVVEPAFSSPFTYDIGWRDIVNKVQVTVEKRGPSTTPEEVFSTEDIWSLSASESIVIPLKASEPFLNAILPVDGKDFITQSGAVQVQLSRTSGQSTDLTLTAVGGPAVVQGMKLRATSISVKSSYTFVAEDTTSIAANGVKTYDGNMPWVSLTDIVPIADVILGKRSNRVPVIKYTLNHGSDERITTLLSTRLSDRVHITEPGTFTDHDYFVEQLEHTVFAAGTGHTATFGCERDVSQPTLVFTFNDPDRGFDDGLFGYTGIDMPDDVFVLDQSDLNEKLLGH